MAELVCEVRSVGLQSLGSSHDPQLPELSSAADVLRNTVFLKIIIGVYCKNSNNVGKHGH